VIPRQNDDDARLFVYRICDGPADELDMNLPRAPDVVTAVNMEQQPEPAARHRTPPARPAGTGANPERAHRTSDGDG